MLETSITSTNRNMTVYTIQCSFATAGVLSLVRTRNGVSTTEKFFNGESLVANALYAFTFVTTTDDIIGSESKNEIINFKYSVNATCNSLIVVSHGGIY